MAYKNWIDGLDETFGLIGQKVKMIKGEHINQVGKIVEIVGYVGAHGVVAQIKLENGKLVEYSADFWEEI